MTAHARLQREPWAASRIPYQALVSGHLLRTAEGHYLQVFRLQGASFECTDDDALNQWHERLNLTWRNLASPQVALWTHLVRRRECPLVKPVSGSGFAERLVQRYQQRLSGETLMINELYLSVIYRPVTGAAPSLLARLITHAEGEREQQEVSAAIDACEKLAAVLKTSLARYEPERLGLYLQQGLPHSQLLEFLGYLLNGEWQRVPVPRAPLNEVLATSRVLFGHEVIEYRLPGSTRYGAMLGIKEYPTPTMVGMFDALLSAPFPLVLTQSFVFLNKATGQALLQRQQARMVNVGDFAVSQAEDLDAALDALTSNEFVMGDLLRTVQN